MADRAGVTSGRQRTGKAAKKTRSTVRIKVISRGSGARDRRTAYAPLKHDSEKITRWSRSGRKGASDTGIAEQGVSATRLPVGVSATATRATLYKIAKRLAIKGRSAMTRRQLMEAISSPAPARVRVKSR